MSTTFFSSFELKIKIQNESRFRSLNDWKWKFEMKMKFQTEISFSFLLNLTYILYHIFGLIVKEILWISVGQLRWPTIIFFLSRFLRFSKDLSSLSLYYRSLRDKTSFQLVNLIIILYHKFGPADNYFLSGTTGFYLNSRGREWPPHLCHTEFFHRSRLQ